MDKSQEWAKNLATAKRKADLQNRLPISLQKKQTQNEITRAKRDLINARASKNKEEVRLVWERLVSLRSDLMGLNLAEVRERFGNVADQIVEREIKAYAEDCALLGMVLE
ncbi:MAG: hypothetical protein KBD73_03140 [Candidatus Magasanikbacteria bacterium]|nr:hypothetical protein [Candidatus Magasanikbacteria bacterium]